MDTSKFLGKFKDATRDHLQRMNELLLRLEQDPGRDDDIKELMREIHTLKGESRMMGFGDMSDLTHAVEDVLRDQEGSGFRGLSSVSDQLFHAFDGLDKLLEEKLGQGPSGFDVEAEIAALRRHMGAPTTRTADSAPASAGPKSEDSFDLGDDLDLGDDIDLGEAPIAPSGPQASHADPEAAMREAFGVPAGKAHEVVPGAPVPPSRPVVVLGGGKSKFLGKFKEATREHLQRIADIVGQLEQDPLHGGDVKELLRQVHTLKGESRMMGFGDMGELAHAIEDLLRWLEARSFAGLAGVREQLGAGLDAAEKLLAEKLGDGPAGVDVEATCRILRDATATESVRPVAPARHAESPRPTAAPAAPTVVAPSDSSVPGAASPFSTSKFMGKFRDATVDHIERMNALLLALELDPQRTEDVRELMREIHTLKGESRMMGFGDMADLAHATEDLLKSLETGGFETLSSRIDLIFEAFDAQQKLLDEKQGKGPAGVDVESLSRRLRGDGATVDAATAAPPPASPRSPPQALSPAPPAPRAPSLPALPPIDPLLSESFRAAASGQVDRALALLSDLARAEARQELARLLEGLRADARMTGLDEVATLVDAVLAVAVPPAGPHAGADRMALPALRRTLESIDLLVAARSAGTDTSTLLESLVRELTAVPAPPPPAPPEPTPVATRAATPARASAPSPAVTPPATPRPAAQPALPEPTRAVTSPRPAEPVAAPAPTRPAATPAPAATAAPATEQTVRISLAKLDELGNLTGDIYLNHTRGDDRQRRMRRLLEVASHQSRAASSLREALVTAGARGVAEAGGIHDAYETLTDTVRSLRRGLAELLRTDRDDNLRVGHSIVDLRERVRELQMLPVSTLFDMYPRMVRDIAKGLGKQVRLVVEGGNVEMDRKVLDEIRDPMVHLLRNAIDHGIESPQARMSAGKVPQGAIRLAAWAEGDHVVIEISDDGAGIDPARIRQSAIRKGLVTPAQAADMSDEQAMHLIFAPGFSSKDEVSDLSGRGVGLDVVRDKVDRLEGRVSLSSEVGGGTRMALRLPLTLALARVLLLRAGGLLVAVPATMVSDVLRLPEAAVRRVETYEAMEWHERTLPLVSLAHVLERQAQPHGKDSRTVVVLSFEEHVVGFVVDRLEGEREVVIKRLDQFLGRVPNVAGATLLSSGEIVVVLHVPQLIASTMGISPLRLQARIRATEEVSAPRRSMRRLLVVDDSIIVRDMMKGVLEEAGFEVTLAVDGMDGLEKQLAGAHDLVITDVEMPRMDGFELTRSLKQNSQQARVPVIIVTTLDSPEAKERGLKVGASAYIVKNLLDMSQLVTTIERLIS